jgi:aspartate racemase
MSGVTYKTAGVLGGMGPLATVDFLSKVVSLTPASCDQEHVPLIVHQVPQIPDRNRAILEGSDTPYAPMLLGLHRLAAAGAEFAVIPCNSAHHWYERLAASQSLRILHIADAVRQELQRRDMASRRVAILATRGTLRSGLYEGRLGEGSTRIVRVDEHAQLLIDHAIRAVKAGQRAPAAQSASEALDRTLDAGARVLILACTELPLALEYSPRLVDCVDSTLALARYCVAESRAEAPT